MRAGQMPRRVDHRHYDQPEDERNPHLPEHAVVGGVGHDRSGSGKDKRERGKTLGEGTVA